MPAVLFAAEFAPHGPRDRSLRELREFDLNTRLLRYPLSYLIYSEAFDAMPQVVRDYVYRRLRAVRGGENAAPELSHLSRTDRDALLQILEDTKPGF